MSEQGKELPEIPGYRLRKLLGRGGMATVFLAEPLAGGQPVAVKVMRAPPGADHEWSARFLREAAILQKFKHPNIVRVFGVGESQGNHYIVMEHLDHGDLSTWIRQGLQPPDALRLLRAIALALDYAHQQGYIHRDVKPDNVLFRADGTAVLTDFGVARQRNTDVKLTQMGMVVGTPRYMSPEQHKGLEVDTRTDIYALGVILYEMLTRQVPFDAEDSMSIGIKHLTEPVPRLPPKFARYQRLVDTLLAKNPADRIARGETVAKAIDVLLSQPEPVAKTAIAATAALERGVDIKETETKTGLFSKACDIAINIGAEDYEALQKNWAKATAALFEWQQDVGKKARNISVDFFVHPWILSRARDYAKTLAASADYAFLLERKARIRIYDLDGGLELEILLGSDVSEN